MWAYDYEGGRIAMHGPTRAYSRSKADPSLEIHFCPTCAGVVGWRGLRLQEDGRRRLAVNPRLAEPELVADLPIDHFEGLTTFADLATDWRCVRDL